MELKNFRLVCKECGGDGIIISAYESRKHDDVDPDIILRIECTLCGKVHREKL